MIAFNAALAQLVEHVIRNDGVRCSSHLSGTTHIVWSFSLTRDKRSNGAARLAGGEQPKRPLPAVDLDLPRISGERFTTLLPSKLQSVAVIDNPAAMRTRRTTLEHLFGTIKERMGYTHLLMKTLPKVATEVALHVLAYNLTRITNIFEVGTLASVIGA